MIVFTATCDGVVRGVFSDQDGAKSAVAQMMDVAPEEIEWRTSDEVGEEDCIFCSAEDGTVEFCVEEFELDRVYYIDEPEPEEDVSSEGEASFGAS